MGHFKICEIGVSQFVDLNPVLVSRLALPGSQVLQLVGVINRSRPK